MELGQQQLICVCILMIDNCSQSLRASAQQSRFICPEPVHSCPEVKPKLLVNEILATKKGLSIEFERIFVIFHETVKQEV